MPRTVEHIVATHKAAWARVAKGLPVWAMKVDLSPVNFRDGTMSFEANRDRAVAILRASLWVKSSPGNPDELGIAELVDELAGTIDEEEFGDVFDSIYDLADTDRVWITTS